MYDLARQRKNVMEAFAKNDPHYLDLLIECRDMENRLVEMETALTHEQSIILWDYICLCEEMSNYILTIACKNMAFIDDSVFAPATQDIFNALVGYHCAAGDQDAFLKLWQRWPKMQLPLLEYLEQIFTARGLNPAIRDHEIAALRRYIDKLWLLYNTNKA